MPQPPRSPVGRHQASVLQDLQTAAAHHQSGRYEDARRFYQKVLKADPRNADALSLFGVLFAQTGDLPQALAMLWKAAASNPRDPGIHFNLASVHRQQGAIAEAVAAYRSALVLDPSNVEIHKNLAVVLKEGGRYEEALDAYAAALNIAPRDAELHYNLGNALKDMGRLREAEASYRRAIDIKPSYIDASNNLASCLFRQDRLSEAEDVYRQIVALAPNFAIARNNLGMVLQAQGRSEDAFASFEWAARLDSKFADPYANMAGILQERQSYPAAREMYKHALAIDPNLHRATVDLLIIQKHSCDWSEWESRWTQVRAITDDQLSRGAKTYLNPFEALSAPLTPGQCLAIAKAWARDIEAKVAYQQQNFSFRAEPRERLRIGYLSNDFGNHATAHLIQSLFSLHDRARMESVVYSFTADVDSAYLHRIRSDCDSFVDIRTLSDAAVAQRIFADRIDILVDLKGFTQNTRLPILAMRPAPIQVGYLGFPGSVGSRFLDYIIADAITLPQDQEDNFTEVAVRLPGCYLMVDDRQPISDDAISRGDVKLPEDAFVFCSFNNPYKIEPQIFGVWMRILQRVPNGVLWIYAPQSEVQHNLRREAATRGIDPQRLIFADAMEKSRHLARHRLADLFLDTSACNAHTTAVDALWAGLPLITQTGPSFATRVATSLLHAIGLPELTLRDAQAYEDMAVELATNPARLAELRRRLQANRTACPLFDSAGRARHLEAAYTAMWRRFAGGLPPGPIEVTENSVAATD
jgi:protein O-GlcNAc transferase